MKKKIEFKLEEELFNKYKKLCEESGFDMSKRLRIFIESEIRHYESGENLIRKIQI
jgi:antitoxin component of RelBE/YafQ-DinJ toxin-antitoxin module